MIQYSFWADSRGRMEPLIASYCFFAFGVMLWYVMEFRHTANRS